MNSERDFYSNGLAVGWLDMLTQRALMRFRDERYEIPAVAFWALVAYQHRFPCIPVERLRRA